MKQIKEPNNPIVRNAVPDGMSGYDERGQFLVCTKDGAGTITSYFSKHDVRGELCSICRAGWENTTASLMDQTVLRTDYFDVKDDGSNRHEHTFAHMSCYEGHLALNERNMWTSILMKNLRPPGMTRESPDFLTWVMEEVPNQYGGAFNTPWYHVELSDGSKLLLGSRKRVYSISACKLNDLSLESELFKGENVTKYHNPENSKFTIHAWNDEKAREYMDEIFKHLFKKEFVKA